MKAIDEREMQETTKENIKRQKKKQKEKKL